MWIRRRRKKKRRESSDGTDKELYRAPMVLASRKSFSQNEIVVLADAAERSDGPFHCLDCHNPVILRKGPVNRPHFAHVAQDTDRTDVLGGGDGHESLLHLSGKLLFLHHLERWTIVERCRYCAHVFDRYVLKDEPGLSSSLKETEFRVGAYVLDAVCLDSTTTQPRLIVEVWQTHAVPDDKRRWLRSQACRFVELRAREIVQRSSTPVDANAWTLTNWDARQRVCDDPRCRDRETPASVTRKTEVIMRRCQDCHETFPIDTMQRFLNPRWFFSPALGKQTFRRYGYVCDEHKVQCESCLHYISTTQARRFRRCLDCNAAAKAARDVSNVLTTSSPSTHPRQFVQLDLNVLRAAYPVMHAYPMYRSRLQQVEIREQLAQRWYVPLHQERWSLEDRQEWITHFGATKSKTGTASNARNGVLYGVETCYLPYYAYRLTPVEQAVISAIHDAIHDTLRTFPPLLLPREPTDSRTTDVIVIDD